MFYLFLLVVTSLPISQPYRFLPDKEITYTYTSYNGNGKTLANIPRVAHHVLILYGARYCSGSLIKSRIILTAASCFVRKKNESIIVKVGANSITGFGQIISVLEYKTHEYFKHLSNLDNDIALLMLKDHVVFSSKVIKAVLVDPEVALRVGTQIVVSGWGSSNMPLKYMNLLLHSEMLVIDRASCKRHYGSLITPSNFCVRFNTERRLSDNGGGAIFEDILVGILSSGIDINSSNFAVLTNVSYFHRWITLNSNRFMRKYCRVKDSLLALSESEEYNEG